MFSTAVLHRSMSCPAQLCSRQTPVKSMAPSIGVEHKALPRVRISATFQAGAPTAEDEEEDLEDKSSEYSDVMKQRMGSSLTYRHEDGVNFAHVLDNLMVGSCLQTRDDVDRYGITLALSNDSSNTVPQTL